MLRKFDSGAVDNKEKNNNSVSKGLMKIIGLAEEASNLEIDSWRMARKAGN